MDTVATFFKWILGFNAKLIRGMSPFSLLCFEIFLFILGIKFGPKILGKNKKNKDKF